MVWKEAQTAYYNRGPLSTYTISWVVKIAPSFQSPRHIKYSGVRRLIIKPTPTLAGLTSAPYQVYFDAETGDQTLRSAIKMCGSSKGGDVYYVLALMAIVSVDDKVVERILRAVPRNGPDLSQSLRS